MKSFLISPVRHMTPEKLKICNRIYHLLENQHWIVYWPYRHTDQDDSTGGLRITHDNKRAMQDSDAVHLIWFGDSQGSVFDLGMAFAMNKVIIPMHMVEIPTEGKSYERVVIEYYRESVALAVQLLKKP